MADEATASSAGHDPRACSGALVRAFGFLGKRWNGVLLATLLDGPAGFAELKRAIAGISDSMLSDRLAELAAAGLVRRSVQAGPPVSTVYALTEAGHGILPAMRALSTWAEEHLPADGDAPAPGAGAGTSRRC